MEPIGLSPRPASDLAGSTDPAESLDPVRVQSAAVAAQQVALSEEESRLAQRRAALERQEEQLAAHLEEKRLKLLHLSERAKAERALVEKERAAYEKHIEKVTGDLSGGQRDLLQKERQLEVERARLLTLRRRLRQRWHRFWLAERHKHQCRQEGIETAERDLEARVRQLEEREKAVGEQRLRFQGVYEVGRLRLREAWQSFREEQARWLHRRGQERAVLRVRQQDLDAVQEQLEQTRRFVADEKRAAEAAKVELLAEIEGLEARVRHQRDKVLEQDQEIARLGAEIEVRRPASADSIGPTDRRGESERGNGALVALGEVAPGAPSGEYPQPGGPPPYQDAWQKRFDYLSRLAGALADQRLQLLEHWQRLVHLQAVWENDRNRGSAELQVIASRLVDTARHVDVREEAGHQAGLILRRRHEELVGLRQELIAWQARLRIREKTLDEERQRLLLDVQGREELVDRYFQTLVDVRQRWTQRRRRELEALRDHRQELNALREEHGQTRLELLERTASLEAEKRVLAEKALALEQYRKEFLAKVESPSGERRLERLRRRWLTLNAQAIRAASREWDSAKAALVRLDSRQAELGTRAESLALLERDLLEKHTAWEHKEALAAGRQARMQQELQSADAQRKLSDQQVARMREEIERIARALIDEPDPPTTEALSHAA